ncbi:MAG: methionyl-tRNA formyltransferase [Pseudomonadota bacterium]
MTVRIVFMGTPDFSVPTLSELIGAGHDVVAVYTQPPRPAGRGQSERKSPVHSFAERAGLTVQTPVSLKSDEAARAFEAHEADVAVVVAYGLILPQAILDAPEYGCLNLHASALPRWRGAAPIQRAIMAGDTKTAVMVMQMEAGLDTGPVCLAEDVPIGPDMTAGELHDVLAARGADCMVRAIAALERGSLVSRPQPDEGVTYAAKIEKGETEIDFEAPASEVHNHIRGLSPFPGAWFADPTADGQRVKVLACTVAGDLGQLTDGMPPGTVIDEALTVACGEGALRLLRLQRAGKAPMPAADFQRGRTIPAGTRIVRSRRN